MRIKTHPGEILHEEFMKPFQLSANALAKALDVPQNRISDVVRGRRGVTADTAMRLAAFFGTTTEFWLNAQSAYDISVAKAEHGTEYAGIKPIEHAA